MENSVEVEFLKLECEKLELTLRKAVPTGTQVPIEVLVSDCIRVAVTATVTKHGFDGGRELKPYTELMFKYKESTLSAEWWIHTLVTEVPFITSADLGISELVIKADTFKLINHLRSLEGN